MLHIGDVTAMQAVDATVILPNVLVALCAVLFTLICEASADLDSVDKRRSVRHHHKRRKCAQAGGA